jgi:peroxiredoxin
MPAFEADMARFEAVDAQVLGISVDSTATNGAWAESLGLESVLLLSDFWPQGTVAQQYGVLRPHGYTERATFIVDKGGIVRYAHIYDINELPDNEPLLQVLQDLQ